MPELRGTSPGAFGPAVGFPWVAVILASCTPEGNYANDEPPPAFVNVVELVCSDASESTWYDALAGRIAAFLGWSAFEDHNRRQVWSPQ
jgi:hypothetical protein